MVILWMQLPDLNSAADSLEDNAHGVDQACVALEWTDSLLRCLDSLSGFRDTVLTTVVVTPPPSLPLKPDDEQNSASKILKRPLPHEQIELDVSTGSNGKRIVLHRPLQSYQFSGTKRVEVDAARPAVVVHRLPGIIRYVLALNFFTVFTLIFH
jgi:hypothetical protein